MTDRDPWDRRLTRDEVDMLAALLAERRWQITTELWHLALLQMRSVEGTLADDD